MSLFSTAYKIQPQWLWFFPCSSLCLFEGEGGNFRQNDSEFSGNKPMQVPAGLFPLLRCWGMKPAASSARLA